MVSTILILGKPESLPAAIGEMLRQQGYEIAVCRNAAQLTQLTGDQNLYLSVLDARIVRLPVLKFLRKLHEQFAQVPVLLLCARSMPRASALATRTLVMPFTEQDLQTGISGLLPLNSGATLVAGALTLDTGRREVNTPLGSHRLTPKVCQLLETLMRRAGQTVSREELMQCIWNTEYMGDTRTLDVHIRWLREQIEPDPSRPVQLVTERGIGYRLVRDGSGQHQKPRND